MNPLRTIAEEGKSYALCVPAQMRISIRGMELMLRDFTRDCGKRPSAILLTRECMAQLCREANRSARIFADDSDGRYPSFQGVMIDYIDPDDTFDIPIVELVTDEVRGNG